MLFSDVDQLVNLLKDNICPCSLCKVVIHMVNKESWENVKGDIIVSLFVQIAVFWFGVGGGWVDIFF